MHPSWHGGLQVLAERGLHFYFHYLHSSTSSMLPLPRLQVSVGRSDSVLMRADSGAGEAGAAGGQAASASGRDERIDS